MEGRAESRPGCMCSDALCPPQEASGTHGASVLPPAGASPPEQVSGRHGVRDTGWEQVRRASLHGCGSVEVTRGTEAAAEDTGP